MPRGQWLSSRRGRPARPCPVVLLSCLVRRAGTCSRQSEFFLTRHRFLCKDLFSTRLPAVRPGEHDTRWRSCSKFIPRLGLIVWAEPLSYATVWCVPTSGRLARCPWELRPPYYYSVQRVCGAAAAYGYCCSFENITDIPKEKTAGYRSKPSDRHHRTAPSRVLSRFL